MSALDTAYSIAILVVALGAVAGVMGLTTREPGEKGSNIAGVLTFLAVAIFLIALVWRIGFA